MENNTSVLHFFYRYRKTFVYAFIAGATLGAIITFFIPKKYASTAVVYPYSSHTKNDIVGNPQFGYEVETEQLMQLLESQAMRDRTIEKFKLYDYYGLDTTNPSWRADLTLEYVEDITFFRSRYLSVVISARTTNPKLSARIANFQVEEIDNYRKEIFESNRKSELRSARRMLDSVNIILRQLKDSIYTIRPEKKGQLYAFVENLNNDNFDASAFVDDPELEHLVDAYVYEFRRKEELRGNYDRKREQYNSPLPSVYAIDRAEPSYRKISPSYVVNTILGAFLLTFVSLTILMIRTKWNSLRKEEQSR